MPDYAFCIHFAYCHCYIGWIIIRLLSPPCGWKLAYTSQQTQPEVVNESQKRRHSALLGNIVIMCMSEFSVCVCECSYFHFPEEFISLPPSQTLTNKREAEKLILSHTTDESFTWCFPIFPIRHQRAFELRGSRQQPCNWSPQTFRDMQVHSSHFRGKLGIDSTGGEMARWIR